jgi:hypothetical protein
MSLHFFLIFLFRKREERLNKKSEGVSEISSWVNRIRKLGEKRNAEKEKALQLSKVFEEQVSCVLIVFLYSTFLSMINFT